MDKKNFYKNLLDSTNDGIYFVDSDRKITFWNRGAERITGFLANDIVGSFCYNNILNHVNDNGDELCKKGCPLYDTIIDGEKRDVTVYLHHKQGHRVPVNIKSIPIKENGKIIGAAEIFGDVIEKNEMLRNIEELKLLSMYDQLTGLANRRYIDAFLESKMNEFLSLDIPFGVGFMDIDKFKNFNDTYGHDIGDEVLKMVSKVFTEITRSSDLIGRWGGEEFIGIFVGINEEKLNSILEKIRMLIEKSSIHRYSEELKVTISIGGAMVKNGDTVGQIVKRADGLLYKSKSSGRNCVTIG